MPKIFLIDLEGSKKQLLDESAALKVIENDFDRIKQITILQDSEMRYRVKLQDKKEYLVEASKMNSFIDQFFPMMESMEVDEAVDWEKTAFYPMVVNAKTKAVVWHGKEMFDLEQAIDQVEGLATKFNRKAEAQNLSLEYCGKVVDQENRIAYTELDDEAIDDLYIEAEPEDEITLDDEGREIASLSDEEEKLFQDFNDMKGEKFEEVKSRALDIKKNFQRYKAEYLQQKQAVETQQEQMNSETLQSKKEMLSKSIQNHEKMANEAKQKMQKSMEHLEALRAEGQEKKEIRDTHREQLKQRYNFDANKATRMANQPNTSKSFADIEALMKQRLGNQNPTTTEAR